MDDIFHYVDRDWEAQSRARREEGRSRDPRTGAPSFPHIWHAWGVLFSGGFWLVGWAIMWHRSPRRRYIRIRTEQLRQADARRYAPEGTDL